MAEQEASRPRFEARVEALLEQMDKCLTDRSQRMTGLETGLTQRMSGLEARMLSLEARMATARELHAWATIILAMIVASGVLTHVWR
jgi:hypothetical protein